MDGTSLIGPAVVAAGVSGAVAVVGFLLSARTTRAIHGERLNFDKELAERKFAFDSKLAQQKLTSDHELAEWKAQADVNLAEKKIKLDAAFADRKRQQDLAEEVLSGFYQMHDLLRRIRTPMRLQGEGESRARIESETEAVARQRDSYYVTLERLEQSRPDIGNLLATRYRAAAWFGADADHAFEKLHGAITGIANAATLLIRWSGDSTQHRDPGLWQQMERMIWWSADESAR